MFVRCRASKFWQFSFWKRPVGAMLMKALPRHSKVEAHLESYFHMEDFCVLYFLFCFSLRFATLFKFLKFPECSFAFHFFKSILQWTLIFTILFIVLFDSSYVYYFDFFLADFFAMFSRHFFQEASAPSSLRRWSWRWLLEAMATTRRENCSFQHHFYCARKTTRRRETCVCTMPFKVT